MCAYGVARESTESTFTVYVHATIKSVTVVRTGYCLSVPGLQFLAKNKFMKFPFTSLDYECLWNSCKRCLQTLGDESDTATNNVASKAKKVQELYQKQNEIEQQVKARYAFMQFPQYGALPTSSPCTCMHRSVDMMDTFK